MIFWNDEKYSSPYAWASQCKNLVNPDHKTGIGWGHVSPGLCNILLLFNSENLIIGFLTIPYKKKNLVRLDKNLEQIFLRFILFSDT